MNGTTDHRNPHRRRELPDFFNRACGPLRGSTNEESTAFQCTTDEFTCGRATTTTTNNNNTPNDITEQNSADSEIRDRQQQHQHSLEADDSHSLVLEEPVNTQRPQQRMKSFMDGIIGPILTCVQPNLEACTSPAMDWTKERRKSKTSTTTTSAVLDARPVLVTSTAGTTGNSGIFSGLSPTTTATAATEKTHHIGTSSTVRTTPQDNDILCGRGNNSNRHPGNQHFRELIAANKSIYTSLTKKEKMLLARQIVDLIIHHTDPPARFLGRDTTTGLWYDIGLPRSLEKTSQALREKTAAVRAADKAHETEEETVSDVFSNITDNGSAIHEGKSANIIIHNNENKIRTAQNGMVEAPLVKIPQHLTVVFGHNFQTQNRRHEASHRHTNPERSSQPEYGLAQPRSYASTPPLPHMAHYHFHQNMHMYRSATVAQPSHYYRPATVPVQHGRGMIPKSSRRTSSSSLDYGNNNHSNIEEHPFDENPCTANAINENIRQFVAPPPANYTLPKTPPPMIRTRHSLLSSTIQNTNQPQHHYSSNSSGRPSTAAIVTPQHPTSNNNSGNNDNYPQKEEHYLHHHTPNMNRLVPHSSSFTPQRSNTQNTSTAPPPSSVSMFSQPLDWSPPKGIKKQYTMADWSPPKSTSLEQDWKRQRTIVGTSTKITTTPLSTQQEYPNTNFSKESSWNELIVNETSQVDLLNNSNISSKSSSNSRSLNNSGASSTGLSQAIEHQLTIQDSIGHTSNPPLQSPSLWNQSYSSRRRQSVESLPRPTKQTALDMSADSMDGMAALAAAAFLRLDEDN